MSVNTDKTKVIESQRKTLMLIFFMTITTWRKCPLTNISELISMTSSIGTIILRKGLMKGGKPILAQKTNLIQQTR